MSELEKVIKVIKGDRQDMVVNGYVIRYNPYWHEWQVSHPEVGGLDSFETRAEAVNHAFKG